MPVIFGTKIDSATYSSGSKTVTVAGEAFADTEYAGVSNIEVSPTGVGAWVPCDSIDSWADVEVSGSFVSALSAGDYDVRVTSSDGEQATITGAFNVSTSGFLAPSRAIDLSICCCL